MGSGGLPPVAGEDADQGGDRGQQRQGGHERQGGDLVEQSDPVERHRPDDGTTAGRPVLERERRGGRPVDLAEPSSGPSGVQLCSPASSRPSSVTAIFGLADDQEDELLEPAIGPPGVR